MSNLQSFVTAGLQQLQGAVFKQLQFTVDQILGAFAGVPGQVASLLGGITEAIRPVLAPIQSAFTSFFNQVNSTLNGVILPFLQNLGSNIAGGLANLGGQLSQVVTPLIQDLQSRVSTVLQQAATLPGFFSAELAKVGDLLQRQTIAASNSIKADLSSVAAIGAANNADINKIIAGVNQFGVDVQKGFGDLSNLGAQISQALLGAITGVANQLKTAVFDPIFDQIQNLPKTISSIIRPTGSITPEDARKQLELMGSISLGVGLGATTAGVVGEVITAGFVDQIGRTLHDFLSELNLGVYSSDLLTREYTVGVRPALDRGILKKYEPLIPGPGDLVNMVVREAFVPEFRTPAPKLFADAMAETGFSQFWSDTFWTAHWRPIDFQQATEMFHRNIITESEYIRRLIILDFRPDDADLMRQLTFRLPNRIEARLMARFGLLEPEQLDEIIRAEGIREDFVEPLRTMMQEFNLTTIFTRTETLAISSFEDGLIGEEQFIKLSQQIKRPPGVIEASLALARLKRDLDFKQFQIKTITKALKRGQITPEEAATKLRTLSVDQEKVNLILAEAAWDLDARINSKTKKAAPDLSVSQIMAAIKSAKITVEDGFNALVARDYAPEEARVLVELSNADLTVAQITKALKAGLRDEPWALKRLTSKGLSEEDAKLLIALA